MDSMKCISILEASLGHISVTSVPSAGETNCARFQKPCQRYAVLSQVLDSANCVVDVNAYVMY